MITIYVQYIAESPQSDDLRCKEQSLITLPLPPVQYLPFGASLSLDAIRNHSGNRELEHGAQAKKEKETF